jgi:hypothetical protein
MAKQGNLYNLRNSKIFSKWNHANHYAVLYIALFYKPDGRGFETQWGEWIFLIYLILPAVLGHEVYSASNRNEYQK